MMGLLSRFLKLQRITARNFRLVAFRLRFGTTSDGGNFSIGRGVRFSATDGGVLRIGRDTAIDDNVVMTAKKGRLEIGRQSFVGMGSVLVAREEIRIGDHALIAEYVTIRDQDHAFRSSSPTSQAGFATSPIIIGDNVWLGAKVTILKGVRIGDNVVIGANSVVTGDIPANVVAAGVPARIIGKVDS